MSAAAPDTAGHPVVELLRRYVEVARWAWNARHDLAGPRRLADERAFLPDAIALQETPPHPSARRAALVILALFVTALAWSVLGEVDVVATASGRIAVSDRSKVVQPLEAAVVRAIHVRDGDKVAAGQVLVELDGTVAEADLNEAQRQRQTSADEAARTAALLDALRAGRPMPSRVPDSAQAQMLAEWNDIAARRSRLDADIAHRDAETVTARELLAKLNTTLPIVRQRESDFRALTDQGFVSNHAGQDRARERIEMERDLATQQARLKECEAAASESRRALASLLAETERGLSDRRAKAELELAQLEQQIRKSTKRTDLTRLVAPVSGTVQQLAVFSLGGVVTPAQTLMVVVPDGADLRADVVVDNKDVGFVHAGQRAEIKVDTFEFARYGTVDANVEWVASDSVNDEKRGAIFPATLRLSKASIDVDGRPVRLGPGMTITAEVKIGRRRVIDFLLSPLKSTTQESLKER